MFLSKKVQTKIIINAAGYNLFFFTLVHICMHSESNACSTLFEFSCDRNTLLSFVTGLKEVM